MDRASPAGPTTVAPPAGYKCRVSHLSVTRCRREAATICPRPGLQVVTGYTSYTHLDPLLTRCPLFACQYSQPKRPGDLDRGPFDLESGVRVTCDVGYLCADFGLPRPLCSRLRPDVRDRQTDVRQTDRRQTASSLTAPRLGDGGITSCAACSGAAAICPPPSASSELNSYRELLDWRS